MNKKSLLAALLLGAAAAFAQSPFGGRGKEWDEQDGYAIVNGDKQRYWLYSTEYFCDYHNWNKKIVGNDTGDQLKEAMIKSQRGFYHCFLPRNCVTK